MILAIDPGDVQSAFVVYDETTGHVHDFLKTWNHHIIGTIHARGQKDSGSPVCDRMAVEMIASYGMAVGREVFETCVWVGRFAQAWDVARGLMGGREPAGSAAEFVYRRDVKLHLCGSMRAKDANVRQALIDRYGPGKERAVGRKAAPGPLYGVSGDVWSALAVAVTAAENRLERGVAA